MRPGLPHDIIPPPGIEAIARGSNCVRPLRFRRLEPRQARELAPQLLLLGAERLGDDDANLGVEVARVPLRIRIAPPSQADAPSGRRSRGHAHGHLAVEHRHAHLRAERRIPRSHGPHDVHVAALETEHAARRYVDAKVEIALRSAAEAGLALARETDALSAEHSR